MTRKCLGSARNFAKTRFRRFRTFRFSTVLDSTPKNIFRRKYLSKFSFSSVWRGFWRATTEWTSKSTSLTNFALNGLILRSVRPKNLGFCEILGDPKTKFTGLLVRSPFPGQNQITSLISILLCRSVIDVQMFCRPLNNQTELLSDCVFMQT